MAALPLPPPLISEDTASRAHRGTTLRWRMQKSEQATESGDEMPSVAAQDPPEGAAEGGTLPIQRKPQEETTPRIF